MIETQGEGQSSALCNRQQEKPGWFKPRGYQHLDAPVGLSFTANAENADFVARHSFLPLLHYVKRTKRYKSEKNKTEFKNRDIMYASHRDACILSRYAYELDRLLNSHYSKVSLSGCVIAYRKLGKANYDFAAEVQTFAREHEPCTILCFDVTDFFGTLDHRLLKQRLKMILGVDELPSDWYKIYRQITRYSYLEIEDFKNHPIFKERLKQRGSKPLAKIGEVISAGIPIHQNKVSGKGIPQGTPISSAVSNLYMVDFDAAMRQFCEEKGALYRRYSDDILVVCNNSLAQETEQFVLSKIAEEKLLINSGKTERRPFDSSDPQNAQYLGFNLAPNGSKIRSSSLSRQWRKLRKSLKRIRKAGELAIAAGRSDKIYTKKLRRRFAPLPVRNFAAYARRSAKVLDEPKILKQARRLERFLEKKIAEFPKGLK
jgi:hypothetical protein